MVLSLCGKKGGMVMNLKDFDFVNECVDFVNTFAPGTAKNLR